MSFQAKVPVKTIPIAPTTTLYLIAEVAGPHKVDRPPLDRGARIEKRIGRAGATTREQGENLPIIREITRDQFKRAFPGIPDGSRFRWHRLQAIRR